MATQWYCRLMGTELGPFTSKQLLEMARSHRLMPDDSVKQGAEGMWVAAHRVKRLFDDASASTIIMARGFPKSQFLGIDYHSDSIATARQRAREAGVDNARFEVATAKNFAGRDFDLICFMDCLHDLGDPAGALVHARNALKPDGKVMLVEPYAGDTVEENLNPIGRLFYAASTMACTPNYLSQEVGLALGAQAGEERLRRLAQQAGFRDLRLATRTPVNLVMEIIR